MTTTDPQWAPPTVAPVQPGPPQPSGSRWRRAPRWARVVAIVLAAFILVGIGAAAGKTRTVTKVDTAALNSTRSQLAAADGKLTSLQQQVTSQQATIKQLQDNAAAVAAQKAQLDQRQAALNASTFGDGLFQVGKDIQAGQYHSSGPGASGNCYWAKLRSSDTGDIIDNNNSTGPQTITINSAYFTSNGCGTWTKVG